jgi:hypothetical protein
MASCSSHTSQSSIPGKGDHVVHRSSGRDPVRDRVFLLRGDFSPTQLKVGGKVAPEPGRHSLELIPDHPHLAIAGPLPSFLTLSDYREGIAARRDFHETRQ